MSYLFNSIGYANANFNCLWKVIGAIEPMRGFICRVVMESKWPGVRLHRSPMNQIRSGLNDIFAARHAGHLKTELAFGAGDRGQRGRRVEIDLRSCLRQSAGNGD